MSDARGATRVFVYGTLKPGGSNHAAYCFDASAAEPAVARGRLLLPPHGRYPYAEAPLDAALAHGCGDASADLAAERRFALELSAAPSPAAPSLAAPSPAEPPAEGERIQGVLLEFPEGAAALARLDGLEGFAVGGGLYDRVLTVVWTGAGRRVAWMYVAPPHGAPAGSTPIGGFWPTEAGGDFAAEG